MPATTQTQPQPRKPGKDASNLERVAWLKAFFVEFNRTEQVTNELRRLHSYGALSRRMGDSADCLLLTGPSGSGKTALLGRYAAQFPRKREELRDRRQVVYVEVPAKCSMKSMAQTLLVALGDIRPTLGNLVQMTARIIHLVREQDVEMVILDEFQHLVDRRNARIAYDVADWVKQLLNQALCPFVLAGLPVAEAVVDGNEQLARRCVGRVRIEPFD